MFNIRGKIKSLLFCHINCFSHQYHVVWIHQSALSNPQTISWKSLNKRLMREFIFLSLLPHTPRLCLALHPECLTLHHVPVMQATFIHLHVYHRVDCLIIKALSQLISCLYFKTETTINSHHLLLFLQWLQNSLVHRQQKWRPTLGIHIL